MFQALFNSLSGLFSFSKSLNTVSNNVSNMNTPGFRSSDTFLSNVNGGLGSRVAGQGLRMQAGNFNPTGNPTDVAIDGNGFFVLSDDNGNLYYTRAGQFTFNDAGFLIDSVNHYKVMAIDAAGNLTAIDKSSYLTLDAIPTSTVNVTGVLNQPPGAAAVDLPGGVTIYDSAGTAHTYTVSIVNKATTIPSNGEFIVTVKEGGVVVGTPGEIHFDPVTGLLQTGFNTVAVTKTLAGVSQTVTLNFGTPGAFTGSTRNDTSGTTSLGALVVDGRPVLGLAREPFFDAQGVMQFVYSAAEKKAGPQVAPASFTN